MEDRVRLVQINSGKDAPEANYFFHFGSGRPQVHDIVIFEDRREGFVIKKWTLFEGKTGTETLTFYPAALGDSRRSFRFRRSVRISRSL